MIKYRLLVASLLALSLRTYCGAQQQDTVTVVSSSLSDSSNNLATGKLSFRPILTNGNPLSYKKPGGGQATIAPIVVNITNGVSTVTLPNTALTNPQNACFSLTLTTSKGYGLGQGYSCLQPHYNAVNANDWCQAGVCNLDNYTPNLTALPNILIDPVADAAAAAAVMIANTALAHSGLFITVNGINVVSVTALTVNGN